MLNPIDSISKTSVKLLLAEPFYGHIMLGLPKEISTQTKTAAVQLMNRENIKLLVNEAFWNNLSEPHRYGLIKHELLHIVLKHLFTLKKYPNKSLFNIAADIVVNQYITPEQLPDGGITIDRFDYLKPMYGIELEKEKDVGYYYRMLDQAQKSNAQMPFESAAQETDDPDRQCSISDLMSEMNDEMERHKFWKDFDSLTEGERKVAERQTNRIIEETAKRVKKKYQGYGNLPAGLAEKLEQILQDMKPQFNWRRVLRLFATTSNSTYLKNTIRRPSKRYGTVPGIKVKRSNRLLVGIDTSGSVAQKELLEFFSEIYFIWKQGAEIQVVECDTHIHNTYNYKGKPPNEIHGRGGTDFNEVIAYGNTEYRPDALIYFTDGGAPAPDVAPRYPILWIISSNGIDKDEDHYNDFPGRILQIT